MINQFSLLGAQQNFQVTAVYRVLCPIRTASAQSVVEVNILKSIEYSLRNDQKSWSDLEIKQLCVDRRVN